MAKVTKLKDRQNNEILPVTRAALVEMNNGISVQAAINNINSAGYITSYTETDPTVPSYVKNITQADITNWNNKLDTFTEVDPTIPSYVRGIKESDIAYWNDKEGKTVAYITEYGTSTPVAVGDTHDEAISKIIKIIDDNEYVTARAISTLDENMSSYVKLTDIGNYGFVTQDDLSNAGYLQTFIETDPTVPSYVKNISQSDITNWNSKTSNTGTITGITMNGASKGTSGVVDLGTVVTSESDPVFTASAAHGIQSSDITNWNAKLDSSSLNNYYTKAEINSAGYLQAHQDLSSYATSAYYDSSTHKIYLRHGSTTLSTIDANDFIKDGMVETAYVQGNNLVISFNTDAGKQPVNVPIADIFNANNYYTKAEINSAGYLQSFTETDPVFSASAAAGIQSSDITNWNSKTSNVGTITGITMNNTSQGTSGVVDLGTVITSETQLSKGITAGNGNAVTDISVSNHQITLKKGATFLTEHQSLSAYVSRTELNNAGYLQSFIEADPVFGASPAAGIQASDITNWNSKTSNTGTITGIKMNGVSKGTSGVVDLGTVITSYTETDPTVPSYVKAITQTDIAYWNDKEGKTVAYITEYGTSTPVAVGDTHDEAISKLIKIINDNEFVTAAALTDLAESIPDTSSYITKAQLSAASYVTQASLSSNGYLTAHQNIKTVNNNTLVGTGNVSVGTITGITMNGASKGTSGVVNLGTVITSHQSLTGYVSKSELNAAGYLTSHQNIKTINNNTITGTGNVSVGTITGITMNGTSKGTSGVVNLGTVVTSETDPIYSASAAAGITSSDISNWNSKTSNTGTITGITMNGVSKGTSGVVDLGTVITSYTETDPIYSASAAAGITSSDISNWNSKTSNTGTITGITMNGVSKGTSGVVDLGTVLTEHQSLSSYATSAYYDSGTRKIYLRHGTTVLSEINANDFIKDGMVETAYVQGGNLVISFNTDAGKQPVNVPITDIFNASNYYTKTEINNAGYLQSHQNIKTINSNSLIGTGNVSVGTITGITMNGASKGTSGVVDLGTVITSYTETDPTVPSHVKSITTTDISNWNNKTNNTGTVTGVKMNGEIKGTAGVVDLGTVITSYTETDPVFSASAAAGIQASDISNWNSKTSNVGTITGITMNNTSKGTSGVVDLGTVVTQETDPTVASYIKSITQSDITNWNNKLSSFTETDPVFVASVAHGISSTDITNWNAKLTKAQADGYYVSYAYVGSLADLTTAELNTIFS